MSESKPKLRLIRQGDLLFVPITEEQLKRESYGNERKVRENGVIAEGEVTGHHHRVEPAALMEAEVFTVGWQNNGPYVRVSENGVSIVHEEHHAVTLEPNTLYRVHIAREFDYLERHQPRNVRD